MNPARPVGVEIVEDRSGQSRCDEGFLRLRRLVVRTIHADGSRSRPYPCDLVRRPQADAVVAVLYRIREDGRVEVLLRESQRVPIYLRREQAGVHPDPREYVTILEVVAGMVEPDDPPGPDGIALRAAQEAREEAGLELDPADLVPLGSETFASPGISDEKLFFVAGEAALDTAHPGEGDGSPMEEWCALQRLELAEALTLCRQGAIPDMKTELALCRLADALGYLPQLGCYASELPAPFDKRFDPLGTGKAPGAGA